MAQNQTKLGGLKLLYGWYKQVSCNLTEHSTQTNYLTLTTTFPLDRPVST